MGSSANDGHPICVEDHPCGGFISTSKVVKIFAVLVLLSLDHLFILLQADY